MDIKDLNRVYFIGIGGIGMSALARYFRSRGTQVAGYDRTATTLTKQLEQEGIHIHYDDDPGLADTKAELIVYTPAIPQDHREMDFFRKGGYTLMKRSEVLGEITNSSFNICIAGTHGKTTITTMTAHILRHSGYGCNAFLGGISVNYGSNFWSHPRDSFVIEADEYDRSFLKLSPDISVITAIDADHLDIYGTAAEVERAFVDFSGRLKPGGLLLSKWGLKKGAELKGEGGHHLTYGLGEFVDMGSGPDILAANIRTERGSYVFDVRVGDEELEGMRLSMGGLHNVENATAAIAIAYHLGITEERIAAAIEAFKGVRRRFEIMLHEPACVLIDDYAHHPEELRALIGGARTLYPGMTCRVIFQPHLYSRTRDFAEGFAKSLDMADEVFLLPIYPARELPIDGVTSALIAEKMVKARVSMMTMEQLMDHIRHVRAEKQSSGLWMTAGAGDIDTLVEPLKKYLTS